MPLSESAQARMAFLSEGEGLPDRIFHKRFFEYRVQEFSFKEILVEK